MSRQVGIYCCVILSMIIWGLSFVWTNSLLAADMPPMSIVLCRLVLSSLCLYPCFLLTKKLQKIRKGDLKFFLLLALFEPFLYFIGETFGLKFSQSPILAAVIVGLAPLFTPLIGYCFYKEPLSFNNFSGITLSVIGVGFVIFHQGVNLEGSWQGILLFSLSVVSSLGYSVVLKKLTFNYNAYSIITYQNSIGAFYFLPFVFYFEWDKVITLPLLSSEILYPLLMLAILASSLAFILNVIGIKELGISRAYIFITLIPVITAIFSFLIGGEEFSLLKSIGIIIVFLGLVLSQRTKKNYTKPT